MIQQTSLLAYREIVDGKLGRNQKLVLEALEEIAPASNKQIAAHMNWPINSVTPRMLELRGQKLNKVVRAYVGKDASGRQAIYWKPRGMVEMSNDSF